MKLLFDENLSDRIIPHIIDIFPGSTHVKTEKLQETDDALIWSFAGRNAYTIVSKDSDFHQRSLLYGAPPKFVFLKIGNCSSASVIDLLRSEEVKLRSFIEDGHSSMLILAP